MHYMYIAKAIYYDGGFDTSIGSLGQATYNSVQITNLTTSYKVYTLLYREPKALPNHRV